MKLVEQIEKKEMKPSPKGKAESVLKGMEQKPLLTLVGFKPGCRFIDSTPKL